MLRLSCALVVVASIGAAPPIPGSTKATWSMDILRRVRIVECGLAVAKSMGGASYRTTPALQTEWARRLDQRSPGQRDASMRRSRLRTDRACEGTGPAAREGLRKKVIAQMGAGPWYPCHRKARAAPLDHAAQLHRLPNTN